MHYACGILNTSRFICTSTLYYDKSLSCKSNMLFLQRDLSFVLIWTGFLIKGLFSHWASGSSNGATSQTGEDAAVQGSLPETDLLKCVWYHCFHVSTLPLALSQLWVSVLRCALTTSSTLLHFQRSVDLSESPLCSHLFSHVVIDLIDSDCQILYEERFINMAHCVWEWRQSTANIDKYVGMFYSNSQSLNYLEYFLQRL